MNRPPESPGLAPAADILDPVPPVIPLTPRDILATWWPLAGSWLLMGLELPAISAAMARLPEGTVSLAAYGGIVFPLALIIEAPIIMLLAASTALCGDMASWRLVRRFMILTAGTLTLLHVLVAFTPLYDLLVGRLLAAPEAIRPAGRVGLMIMTPWTFSIAYRRMQQGLLIRFGKSHFVGLGTAVRLSANLIVIALGLTLKRWPGIVVGTTAVAAGVVSEALFAGFNSRSIRRGPLQAAPPPATPLTFPAFLHFYVPLALTSLLMLITMPIGSAAMGRMPGAVASLAVWPVVTGFVFTLRSIGFAYNEVVVSLLPRPGAVPALHRFAWRLAAASSGLLLVLAATPLGGFWFRRIMAIDPDLVPLARHGLWLAVLMPGLSAMQSWYQGTLVYARRTRGVTEAVIVYLAASALLLGAAVIFGRLTGLYAGLGAMVICTLLQTAWLRWRAGAALRELATG